VGLQTKSSGGRRTSVVVAALCSTRSTISDLAGGRCGGKFAARFEGEPDGRGDLTDSERKVVPLNEAEWEASTGVAMLC